MLALELAVYCRPVGLDAAPMPLLGIGTGKQPASSTSFGCGQMRPAASRRRIVSRIIEGAAPIRRAISRIEFRPTSI
ncbi:hypothetical protein [Bradyrhizobium sp. SEMIA]|uniref:hypothetical protein n=1 Tax=Bradyrhizobium sp. SEMIA TaxID=2597515 RepID=UPI002240325C|nr:hypothetical protein [Bradyrhizobium sp. SEMIA]